MFMYAEIHGFILRCLKIWVCGFLFTWKDFLLIGDMHISAYIDSCQHCMEEDVYIGSLQSAGSHL